MAAGRYRDRVTFLRLGPGGQPGEQTDEYGNPIDDYGNSTGELQDHLTVWGDMLETLGKERVASGRVEAGKTATLRVRWSSAIAGITEADAVRARGENWNIRSIVRVGRRREVVEMLIEQGAAL